MADQKKKAPWVINMVAADHPDFKSSTAADWKARHIDALVIPLGITSHLEGVQDEKKIREIFTTIAAKAFDLEVYIGLALHHTDGGLKQTLYAWEDDASWKRLNANLALIAKLAAEYKFKGILFDSECPWAYLEGQNAKLVWREGRREKVTPRAQAMAHAILDGHPLVVGHYTMHTFEMDQPNYRHFWMDFFTEAKKMKAQTMTLVDDTYWKFDHANWDAFEEKFTRYYNSDIVPGWFPTYGARLPSADNTKLFKQAMGKFGRLFLYQDAWGFTGKPELTAATVQAVAAVKGLK